MLDRTSFLSKLVYTIEAISMLLAVHFVVASKHIVGFIENGLIQFVPHIVFLVLIYVVISKGFETQAYFSRTPTSIVLTSFIVQLIFSLVLSATYFISVSSFQWHWSFLVTYTLAGTFIVSLLHLSIYYYLTKYAKRKSILILGKEKAVKIALENIEDVIKPFQQITHVVIGNYLLHLKNEIDKVDIVYIAGKIDPVERQEIYNYLITKNKTLYITTNIENTIALNSSLINISDESILQLSPYFLSTEQVVIKRLLDILISLLLLLFLSPVMLITIIAIKLESPGPVFYRQERVTLNQQVFSILKFRSMVVNAEEATGPVLAKANDSRVTKVGRIIRSTRIDEIPQLINVLKGEMSLIGPRPERTSFVEQFTKENQFYSLRHNVRAGITGYAQVYGKYTSGFESKLKFDLLYIKNYSILLDFKLLLKTIVVVFDKLSSQGEIEEKSPLQKATISKDILILR